MTRLKTIKKRWNAKTPSFFVGIKKMALTLGTSATAVLLVNQSFSIDLNGSILSICKYIIVVCAAMGMTSQLTMASPTDPK